MGLRLYDTLSGRKKRFEPIREHKVKMFVCGPTVYDSTHLGHARTFIVYEVLARYLRRKGFNVFFVTNLTDIDDKVFERAEQEGISYQKVAQHYAHEFREALEALNIDTITLFAKASDYLDSEVAQVSKIFSDGYAYMIEGNVYFDTSKFPEYGKLSHQSPLELRMRRIEPSPEKRNQADFFLWRRHDEYPSWDSPFGKGRPGWHIEDTAIAISNLGPRYDIHGGGVELVFPHHEAEIAQAEVLTKSKPYVNYWVHTGLLKVKGRKMSRSLGNCVPLRELLKRHGPDTIRIFSLSTHYRRDVNFSERSLVKASISADRILRAWNALQRDRRGAKSFAERIVGLERQFYRSMDDDLNTPVAIAALLSLAKLVNERSTDFDPESRSEAKRALGEMLGILGIAT